jgi:carbohydrate-selective porin OprB
MTAVQVTKDEQSWLSNQGYDHHRVEYAVGASAMINVFDSVYVGPYVEYLYNTNPVFAANSVVNPGHDQASDGLGVGLILTIPLGHLAGLTPKRSPYDGHYP